jgi:hypothetical protein
MLTLNDVVPEAAERYRSLRVLGSAVGGAGALRAMGQRRRVAEAATRSGALMRTEVPFSAPIDNCQLVQEFNRTEARGLRHQGASW